MAEPTEPPLPPRELMSGVGLEPDDQLEIAYLLIGEDVKARVVRMLGPDWDWEGRRALDFGCGSGRLLRQFTEEARLAEFHGSDIDAEMVAWVRENLCPPVAGAQVNGERPPLDYPDGHFDLVTAVSVFTHIADGWSDWLLEMRRILKPEGILVASFLDSHYARYLQYPADDERFGMSAFGFADPDMHWPNVLHSHWWLREHWGRAFDVLDLQPGTTDEYEGGLRIPTQGWIALRRREGEVTALDLEREDPDDPRYRESRRYQLDLLRAEGDALRRRFDAMAESASWRITSPLRRAASAARSARARLRRNGSP